MKAFLEGFWDEKPRGAASARQRRRSEERMDATTETTSVERELSIAASPETVWEFLVDPEKMTRWMGEHATLEPRPGGLYQVGVIPGHTARGEIMEFDPPRRLVFTWGWDERQRRRARLVDDRDRARARRRRRPSSGSRTSGCPTPSRRSRTRTVGTTTSPGSSAPRAGRIPAATRGSTATCPRRPQVPGTSVPGTTFNHRPTTRVAGRWSSARSVVRASRSARSASAR